MAGQFSSITTETDESSVGKARPKSFGARFFIRKAPHHGGALEYSNDLKGSYGADISRAPSLAVTTLTWFVAT